MDLLLDSSVIVKWFLDEPGSDRAIDLQRRFLSGSLSLFFADLSLFEVANALLFSRRFHTDEVADAIAAVTALNMQQLSFERRALADAIALAGQYRVAIYDSYLVALAKRHRLVFITADHKLLRRLSLLDIVQDFEYHP